MICPNCGAQCPDGTKFCIECGKEIPAVDLTKPVSTEPMMSAPSSSIPQPTSSAMSQPTSSAAPQSGTSQMPQNSSFGYQAGQSSYIPPQTYAPVVPVKRSKTPVIIGVVVAVVAVLAIVFFVFIMPNLGGGGLAHKWSVTESGVTMTYDFKDNKLEALGVSMPIEWKDEGSGKLSVTMSFMGMSETQYYTYELNGRNLTLIDEDGNSVVFTRAD